MADFTSQDVINYSTNLELALQTMTAPFRNYCMSELAGPGQITHRFLSTLSESEAEERTAAVELINPKTAEYDARWVNMPNKHNWHTVIGDMDLMRTNISPQGAFVRNAAAALNRKATDSFIAAFFGTAKTGASAGTSTSFLSDNVIAVDTGAGAPTGLNEEKLVEVVAKAKALEVDLDSESLYIGINAKGWKDLAQKTKVLSADFNGGVAAFRTGVLPEVYGIKFVHCESLTKDASGYWRLPVWVPSGMSEAVWQEPMTDIRNLPNYKGNPALVEAESCIAYSRTDEKKCFEVKITA